MKITIKLLTTLLAVFAGFALNAGPLHDAAKKGDLPEVKKLVELHKENYARSKVISAWQNFCASLLDYKLIEFPDVTTYINTIDPFTANTALHCTAIAGHREVASYLLNEGANIDIQNKYGWTPLHRAVIEEKIDMIKYLIGKGAHINALDQDYRTPLHFAAIREGINIFKYLVENGADFNAIDKYGDTPSILTDDVDIQNYVIDVQNYYTNRTIVAINPQNELTIPNYFALAVLLQDPFDVYEIFKHQKNSKDSTEVPSLNYYLKLAKRLNKQLSYDKLLQLKDKLGLLKKDTNGVVTKKSLFQKTTTKYSPFVDVLLLTHKN